MAGTRQRNWSMVTYASKADIDKKLMSLDSVKHYVYIYHDKDGVQPHWHLVVNFDNSISFNRVCELFTFDGCNTLVESVNSVKGIYNYLTHCDEPDKHKYDDDDLYSDDFCYWVRQCNLDRTSEILQAMLDGASLRVLAQAYGREFIFNYHSFRKLADDILIQEKRLDYELNVSKRYENARKAKTEYIQDHLIELKGEKPLF